MVAAALQDLKNDQLQMMNAANLQGQPMATERFEQDASNSTKQGENIGHHPVGSTTTSTTTETQQFTNEVTEMGPEIPFEIGQFLLYKGHFLNLLHFPIWKVHTKTLLLKYDTVLADSEIAWEATDEV